MPICTTAQYRAKFIYCDLPDDSLAEWLADAEQKIESELLAPHGVAVDGLGEKSKATCLRLVRDMVHRAIGDGSSYMNGMNGTTQFFANDGNYSSTVNMGNGFADLFIRKDERREVLNDLNADGLTTDGSTRAAVAAPSFGIFDG